MGAMLGATQVCQRNHWRTACAQPGSAGVPMVNYLAYRAAVACYGSNRRFFVGGRDPAAELKRRAAIMFGPDDAFGRFPNSLFHP
jgi:hypothetical protein